MRLTLCLVQLIGMAPPPSVGGPHPICRGPGSNTEEEGISPSLLIFGLEHHSCLWTQLKEEFTPWAFLGLLFSAPAIVSAKSLFILLPFLIFDTESHSVPRLTSYSLQFSCLSLPNAGIVTYFQHLLCFFSYYVIQLFSLGLSLSRSL